MNALAIRAFLLGFAVAWFLSFESLGAGIGACPHSDGRVGIQSISNVSVVIRLPCVPETTRRSR